MNKFIVFLLVAVSVFVPLSLSSKVTTNKNQPALVNPTPTPKFSAEIEKLALDRNEVLIPCPPLPYRSRTFENSPCFKEFDGLITVKTVVNNPKNRTLTYQYTISGGRITGQGEKVAWNLEGVRPGIYTITVAIGEGNGFSDNTQTQTITVRECDCPHICSCPALDVSGGGVIKGGETVNFEAHVSGGAVDEITYNWTVTQGEIVEGQGTPKIKVKTTSEMTGVVKATVEIGSTGLCADCPRTASETATIIK